MLVPQLESYAQKYSNIKFQREDGILQMTLHTNDSDLVWGFPPHEELGYCAGRKYYSTDHSESGSAGRV